MAWNPIYRAAFRARDDDGAISTGRLSYRADNLAGARAHLVALLPLIASVSSCAIEGATLSNTNYITDTPPGVGADAHRQIVLSLRCSDDTIFALAIPGVEADVVVADGPMAGVGVNLTHVAIVALVAALTTGIGGIAPVSPTGQSIEEAVGGYVGYDEGRW